MNSKTSILIVEDESIVAADIENRLLVLGYNVAGIAMSSEKTLDLIDKMHPDLVLMDIKLKGKTNGIDTAKILKGKYDLPVVYITGYADRNTLQQIKETEPFGFITKPFDDTELMGVIETAIHKYRMEQKLKESEEKYRILLQHTDDAIAIVQNRKIVYCSPAYEKFIGFTQEETINKSFLDFVISSDREGLRKYYEKHRKEEKIPKQCEVTLLHKNGRKLLVEIKTSLIEYAGKKASLLVIHNITELKKAEKRINHLNTVLRSIRNVNQLITREKNRKRLIHGICDTLVETRGYGFAWIGLRNEEKQFIHFAESGIGKDFKILTKILTQNKQVFCVQQALKKSGPIIIRDMNNTCTGCPLLGERYETNALTMRLEYENQVFGVLTVYVSKEYVYGQEEKQLYKEIGDDIGFALHGIEIEEKQKQIEEALQESQKHFRSIYENSAIGMYRTTPDGKILMANSVLIKMLGYSSFEELSQRNLEEEGFEPNYPCKKFKRLIEKKGKVIGFESVWKQKDGKKMYIRESASAFKDSKGNTIYYEGTVEDITERKHMEDMLRESEEKFRSFLNSTSNLAFLKDKNFRHVMINTAYKNFLNKKEEEIIGMTDFDLLPKQLAKQCRESDKKAIITGKVVVIEEKYGDNYYETRKFPVKIKDKIGVGGIITNITERKQAEIMQQKAKQEKVNILDAQLEHVIYEDKEMKILWPNQAACDSVSMKREDLIGRYCYEIWPEIDKPCEDCPVILAMKTRKPQSIEKSTPDGRFWFIRGYPVRDLNDQIIGAIEVTQEITKRKLAEEQIKKDLEEKDILLKEIHHRVKNNLQVMRSLIHLQQIQEKNPVFQESAKKLSNRILSMALIHEQLYSHMIESTKNFCYYMYRNFHER